MENSHSCYHLIAYRRESFTPSGEHHSSCFDTNLCSTYEEVVKALAEYLYLNRVKEDSVNFYQFLLMKDGRILNDDFFGTYGTFFSDEDACDLEFVHGDGEAANDIYAEAVNIVNTRRNKERVEARDKILEEEKRIRDEELATLARLKEKYEK